MTGWPGRTCTSPVKYSPSVFQQYRRSRLPRTMRTTPTAKDAARRDTGNDHASMKASGNARTSADDIATVITFTEPRSLDSASLDVLRARRMIPASGTIAQTYTAQNTRAYGQTNGGGVILSGSASSAGVRSATAAARTTI